MKKTTRLFTAILSLSLLSPTLIACKDAPPSTNLGSDTSVESSNSTLSPEEIPPLETPVLPEPPKVETTQYLQCTGNSVYFRSGAGTSFGVVGSAKKGETYAVIGKKGNWYETYYRGKKVYISASYVSLLTLEKHKNDKIENVLQEGYKLLGVPYVYGAVRFHDGKGNLLGGFNAQKFDCSSLVQYVFYKGASTVLDVTTRTQVVQGKRVNSNDLQRGDCMYFTNESRKHLTGVQRVGHVAIYLGDNYILHTASDYARIEKISSARWGYFLEARRFT